MSYQNSHNARYSVPVEDLIRNFANTRFACGLEVVVEFQYKYNAPRNESYFCRVCHQDIAHYNFMLHCCTLTHLYRYTKSRFPIEYSRMVDSDNLSKSTHLIRDIFLKKLSSHQALPKPNLKVITVYSDRDYYMARDDIMKKYPFVELNEVDLNRLIEMNQNEEYDQINEASDIRPEPLPGSVKPTFLKQLMGDDDMDDY